MVSPTTEIRVVAAVIRLDGSIFAAKRREGGPAGLMWEFPGGKIEPNETPQEALERELKEELEMNVAVGEFIGTFSTPLGDRLIHLECYWCEARGKEFKLHVHVDAGWYDPQNLSLLDWAAPDIPVVRHVQTCRKTD